jgi:hypothetical protein
MDEQGDFWINFSGSTCLAAASYDSTLSRLKLRFVQGDTTYTYDGFPKAKWAGLLKASSKGTFFHQHIEGRYQAAGYA